MLSEEEKNALKCLEWDMLDSKQIEIVLNLIKNQQKEIEVLRKENFDTVYMKAVADFKDKIREEIKQLEEQEDWYIEHKSLDDLYGRIDELEQLLEE